MSFYLNVGFRQVPEALPAFLAQQGYEEIPAKLTRQLEFARKSQERLPALVYIPDVTPFRKDLEDWDWAGHKIVSHLSIQVPVTILRSSVFQREVGRLAEEVIRKYDAIGYDVLNRSFFIKGDLIGAGDLS